MSRMFFTSESVSEGHPDKVADQISDAILDAYLTIDPNAHVAVETMVTTQTVIISGEVSSFASVNHKQVVKHTIKHIGYDKHNMGFSVDGITIIDLIHEQSVDIDRGVSKQNMEEQGAGDQGIMFGYATNETDNYMPLTIDLSNRIVKALADIRREGKVMTYLRPDAKSQVTVEYEYGKPVRIDTIVVSTQHEEFASDAAMQETIRKDVIDIVIPRVLSEINSKDIKDLFDTNITYHVNPTGKFVIGGPNGDTGVTGRKIIVDTYGGWGAHGGGAFSGKDPSKVDRSAAYAARHIAKNLVALGMADRMLIQLSYAIGVAEPVSIFVNTYGTAKNCTDSDIADYIKRTVDLRPASIVKRFRLLRPIYLQTAAYGHFGKSALPWEQLDWDIQV